MRSLLAVAVSVLWCNNVESAAHDYTSSAPAFVSGVMCGRMSRKRPRGVARMASAGVPAAAMAGSFTAARLACGESSWFGVAGEGRRRGTQEAAAEGGGGRAGLRMYDIGFQPPEFGVLLHGTVKAIMLGAFAALIPKITAERIREKEAGLALDEAYEAGLLDDEFFGDGDGDELGYAGGYVCATCDNTNEVECAKCEGKGFFVSASAMPKKCGYCSGLGTFACPECTERRERLRSERRARVPPRELPPARGDDFPFTR